MDEVINCSSFLCAKSRHVCIHASELPKQDDFLWPIYENIENEGDYETHVRIVLKPSDFRLVTDIDASEFSLSSLVKTGVVPSVVSPASFYVGSRIDNVSLAEDAGRIMSNNLDKFTVQPQIADNNE